MKIQYIGNGTPAPQVLSFPGGSIRKWQTMTVAAIPPWVASAPAGTFLVDGKLNPGPSAEKPAKPKPPKATVTKE